MKKLLLFVILTNMISCYTYVNDELPRIRAIKPKIKIDAISFRITGIEDKKDLSDYNRVVRKNLENSNLFQVVNVIDVNDKLDKADKHHLEIHLKKLDVFENRWLHGVSFIPFFMTVFIPVLSISVCPSFSDTFPSVTSHCISVISLQRKCLFRKSHSHINFQIDHSLIQTKIFFS